MPGSALINTTDWSQFLDHGSDIPPDIIFNVMEKGKQNEDDMIKLEDWKTHKVSAHKFLLAGVSPVFRKEFFELLNTTQDTVDVKETTITAFTTMINCIYKPNILQNMECPEILCEVLKLAERYQIAELKKYTKHTLENLKVTPENMLFIASTAKSYAAVFEDVSKMLIDKCGAFLKTKLSTFDEMFDLLHCSHSSFPDGNTELLLELMRANAKCPNCRMTSNQCLDGKDVDQVALAACSENFRIRNQVTGGFMVSLKNKTQEDTCPFCKSDKEHVSIGSTGLAVLSLGEANPGRRGPINFGCGQTSTGKSAEWPLMCSDHNRPNEIDYFLKGQIKGQINYGGNTGGKVTNFNLKTSNGDAALIFACKKSSLRTKNMVYV